MKHFQTIGECRFCGEVTQVCGKCHACDDCHAESIIDQLVNMTPDENNATYINLITSGNKKFKLLARILSGELNEDDGFAQIEAINAADPNWKPRD